MNAQKCRQHALAICAAACCCLLAPAAWAQAHGGYPHGQDFHGRDFNHFGAHESEHWRGGHWTHGWHGGRYAWWWTVDGFWYFYPEPVYPYPTYIPPAIVMQQAPPTPSGLPPAQFWYYCDNPHGYYPYVASCNSPWREVPATPAPVSQ